MRRALAGSFALAISAALMAMALSNGAFSEDAQFEDVQTDGSQIVAAGAADEQPASKNLNTVPIDGLGPQVAKGADSRLVRQLMAARPNEDLVICVAGCFSGRDRVVYAQPIDKTAATSRKPAQTSGLPAPGRQSSVQPADLSRSSAPAPAPEAAKPASKVASTEPAKAPVTLSRDPRAPTILNGASDGTSGMASDPRATLKGPTYSQTN
jgi:hypothetical protein